MVGQDADRGDSRVEREAGRRRVWGADRRDLEAGSLANWSRALDDGRRELLAGVGHELKTPLSIVLGLCGRLLAADELAAEQTQDVQRIRANAYVLLKRVDELLQVSRLDAGHLALDPRDVDVAGLIRSSCEGFASVAEMRGQRLVLEAPAQLRACVDEEKVLSVVSNLLANALKHAPVGGLVRCSVAAVDGTLRIEVADDGPGIAVGQRRAIFERYRQGSGSASRPSGSGLGLAIVRDLVALHHGRVTLSDAPEGGALFSVELPREPAASEPAPIRLSQQLAAARRTRYVKEHLAAELAGTAPPPLEELGLPSVLLVDSDPDRSGALTDSLLGRAGVFTASEATEALRLATDLQPDMVVIGDLDGEITPTALLDRMAREWRLAGVLRVAMVQRGGDPAVRTSLLESGAQDFIAEPAGPEEMRARFHLLLEHAALRRRAEAAEAELRRLRGTP